MLDQAGPYRQLNGCAEKNSKQGHQLLICCILAVPEILQIGVLKGIIVNMLLSGSFDGGNVWQPYHQQELLHIFILINDCDRLYFVVQRAMVVFRSIPITCRSCPPYTSFSFAAEAAIVEALTVRPLKSLALLS